MAAAAAALRHASDSCCGGALRIVASRCVEASVAHRPAGCKCGALGKHKRRGHHRQDISRDGHWWARVCKHTDMPSACVPTVSARLCFTYWSYPTKRRSSTSSAMRSQPARSRINRRHDTTSASTPNATHAPSNRFRTVVLLLLASARPCGWRCSQS